MTSWRRAAHAKIGQGRENAKSYLREHPAVCAEVETKVREKHGLPADETVAALVANAAEEEAQDAAFAEAGLKDEE